jgi:hypothetical protein
VMDTTISDGNGDGLRFRAGRVATSSITTESADAEQRDNGDRSAPRRGLTPSITDEMEQEEMESSDGKRERSRTVRDRMPGWHLLAR